VSWKFRRVSGARKVRREMPRSFFLMIPFAVLAFSCGTDVAEEQGDVTDEVMSSSADLNSHGSVVPFIFEVVRVPTQPGQNVFLVGDAVALKQWDVSRAIPCRPIEPGEGQEGRFTYAWACNAKLKEGAAIQFKFVMIDGAGNVVWESGANRQYTIPVNSLGQGCVYDDWNPALNPTPNRGC
jgi:hypothetical protein